MIAKALKIKTPKSFLSRSNGIYRDENNKIILKNDAAFILSHSGEVFAKPTMNSNSGKGCFVLDNISEKDAYEIFNTLGEDFVIQEKLSCHDDIAKIYSGSVNTFRIITYIWHNKINSCPATLRIGQGGSYLDNAHAGGVFIALDNDGTLHKTAFTEFNKQFTEHPDTKFIFNGHKIKNFPDALNAAKIMHENIPQVGIINWDFTIDKNGNPVLIEGNMIAGSIWLSEMPHGCGAFGDNTAEILQWTRKMKNMKKSERIKYTLGR